MTKVLSRKLLLVLVMENSELTYSWRQISNLLDKNDGAIFIAHRDRFKSNVAALRQAFESRYPKIGIGYAYKTNHLPKLCIDADKLGRYAEVVSGTEFHIARTLGVDGKRILFNGPAKTDDELRAAFLHGALVNVDSMSEARQVAAIAPEYRSTVRLGLRCNLDINWQDRHSRFGLSEANGDLDKAYHLLSNVENIRVEGLHCHTSFDRSAESYSKRVSKLIQIADRLFNNVPPKFLDIGGGLCGPMSLKLRKQFESPPPTFEDYARAICEPIIERYGSQGPEIIVEPGVGLLGNVLEYIFRVEHVKQIGSKQFAVTSGASHHIKIVPSTFNLPTRLLSQNEENPKGCNEADIDIVG